LADWTLVDVSDCIASLRREGDLLAAAAAGAALDGPVPSCPGWQVRDLVQHIGGVHRWAAAHVAVPWTRRMTDAETNEAIGPYPDDGALVDWYRDAHAALVHTLETADPAVACWTFLPAPSPVAF